MAAAIKLCHALATFITLFLYDIKNNVKRRQEKEKNSDLGGHYICLAAHRQHISEVHVLCLDKKLHCHINAS